MDEKNLNEQAGKFVDWAKKNIPGFELRKEQIRVLNAFYSILRGGGKTYLLSAMQKYEESNG